MMGDIFQISRSARQLGYGAACHDVIRCIASADGAELDKKTLLWMIEQVNNLRKDEK